ncbi:MAG: chromosomal replication initiator protein DnaA [Spirochaetes bacterium]|nr:chromosomal replication initiator protein DnaA [Spirochaetota bacterium]
MMEEIWGKVLDNMRTDINRQSFDMWFKDTKPVSVNENTLFIRVPDDVARRHISDNYSPYIEALITDLTDRNLTCEFVIENDELNTESGKPADENLKDDDNDFLISDASEHGSPLYPQYTFENFVVGPNNQLAHAAAVSVSKSPATQYNPLFLYGGTGLGKTHLMQAIGHYIAKEKPYLNVLYVSSEHFINEFIQSVRTNTMNSFKIKYRNVDILLIDDIQFIEKKEQTQEEFFHTFNELYNNKKQIIITSDRPPKELSTLEERLRTRFEWGLITDIQLPNLETREAILRNKAELEGIEIPDEVLNYIARRIKSSIRALEAALKRLNIVSSVSKTPISIQDAKIHLKTLFDDEMETKVSTSDIMNKVAGKYNVSVEDITSKSRHSRFIKPRFIAMYLSRKLTNLTTTDIGKEFGDRDHSTVLNAMNNVERMMEEEEEMKEMIEEMIQELRF